MSNQTTDRVAELVAQVSRTVKRLKVPASEYGKVKVKLPLDSVISLIAAAERCSAPEPSEQPVLWPCPNPSIDGLDISGRLIGPNVFAIGCISWNSTHNRWECLADMSGALCSVEVKVRDGLPTAEQVNGYRVGDRVICMWETTRKDVATIKALPMAAGKLYIICWPDGAEICVPADAMWKAQPETKGEQS